MKSQNLEPEVSSSTNSDHAEGTALRLETPSQSDALSNGKLQSGNSDITGSAKPTEKATEQSCPTPNPRRRRRTCKSEHGLPDAAQLYKLAAVYLEVQRKNWPQLVDAGFLPEPTQATLDDMVQDFKHRHAGGTPKAPFPLPTKLVGHIGAAYSRYSCDNSNPHSIEDQLVNELNKAKQEVKCFTQSETNRLSELRVISAAV